MTDAPSRGTTIATVPPAASAASYATPSRPSPASTASTIRRCSPLSRSTRVAAVGAATPQLPLARRRGSRGVRVGLQCVLAGLAGPDPVRLLHGQDEHLAVADGAGTTVLED